MNSAEKYFQHIENICGNGGQFYRITNDYEAPSISIVSYANVPEPGCTTAFSYGLSSVNRDEWKNSRPELVISVNSSDSAWPLAMGELIRNGRYKCAFSYGMMLNFGQRVADESEMTHFLVFACIMLEDDDLVVELDDRTVRFSQLYPIHASEVSIVKEIGVEQFFFKCNINFFDVKRPPFSLQHD